MLFDTREEDQGKKRHVLVDSQGLLMQAVIHAADLQDRDGGVLLMASLFGMFPFLSSSTPTAVIKGRSSSMDSARSASAGQRRAKRWIVERTIAWLNRCRRLAKDWERLMPRDNQGEKDRQSG